MRHVLVSNDTLSNAFDLEAGPFSRESPLLKWHQPEEPETCNPQCASVSSSANKDSRAEIADLQKFPAFRWHFFPKLMENYSSDLQTEYTSVMLLGGCRKQLDYFPCYSLFTSVISHECTTLTIKEMKCWKADKTGQMFLPTYVVWVSIKHHDSRISWTHLSPAHVTASNNRAVATKYYRLRKALE